MKCTALTTSVMLLLAGCAAPRIQYYQLSVLPPQAADKGTGPVLLVGHIATAQALRDGRIRYREGANAVGSYEYHRWSDPPGIMVKQALIHALRASGKFGSVEESTSAAAADYAVRGTLLEFAEVDGPGIQTLVSLDVELRDLKAGRVVWTRVLTNKEPVDAKKMPDVVRSLDHNLQTVVSDATGNMVAYVAAHPLASR